MPIAIPPMPDEFIAHRERLHRRMPDGKWVHKNATAGAPPYWREFRYELDWDAEISWVSACAEAAYEASKREEGLVGHRVVFTPETVERRGPDGHIAGIAVYGATMHAWQRYHDDKWSLPVQMLRCSALADEGVYLESIDSDKRSYFFYVPDAYVRFVNFEPDLVASMRAEWLAKRVVEAPEPFVGKTVVRRDTLVCVSPYDRRTVILRAGDLVEVSERYHAPLVFPGTTTEGVKHFDVRMANGTVVRSVRYEVLAVNGGWDVPDLPHGGPTILDECRAVFVPAESTNG